MRNNIPCMLLGLDADGESRELFYYRVEKAISFGIAAMLPSPDGPPWIGWQVWANHPDTGEWCCFAENCV